MILGKISLYSSGNGGTLLLRNFTSGTTIDTLSTGSGTTIQYPSYVRSFTSGDIFGYIAGATPDGGAGNVRVESDSTLQVVFLGV